ncbi:MAG: hypothetical protein HUK21_10635 [Fibrobacteraceae bacterium]|nr:hypothetical protein [Fibrobacteraceae bacterium]
MPLKILYLLTLPMLISVIPYSASYVFDVPQGYGILSIDYFIFLVMLAVLQEKASGKYKGISLATFVVFTFFVIIADWISFFYTTYYMTLADVWIIASYHWWGHFVFVLTPIVQAFVVLFVAFLFARKIRVCLKIIHGLVQRRFIGFQVLLQMGSHDYSELKIYIEQSHLIEKTV